MTITLFPPFILRRTARRPGRRLPSSAPSRLLGIFPFAPLHALVVDPHLPEWLPEITLNGLRIGHGSVDIRFYRTANGKSSYEVLQKRGTVHVVHQPSPWSLTASLWERVKDLITSMA